MLLASAASSGPSPFGPSGCGPERLDKRAREIAAVWVNTRRASAPGWRTRRRLPEYGAAMVGGFAGSGGRGEERSQRGEGSDKSSDKSSDMGLR